MNRAGVASAPLRGPVLGACPLCAVHRGAAPADDGPAGRVGAAGVKTVTQGEGVNWSHDHISFSLDVNLLSTALFVGNCHRNKNRKQAIHLTFLVHFECIFSRVFM